MYLYKVHDLDLMVLKKNSSFQFQKVITCALKAFIKGDALRINLPDDFECKSIDYPSKCYYNYTTEDEEIIDFLNNVVIRNKSQFLKQLLRSYMTPKLLSSYLEYPHKEKILQNSYESDLEKNFTDVTLKKRISKDNINKGKETVPEVKTEKSEIIKKDIADTIKESEETAEVAEINSEKKAVVEKINIEPTLNNDTAIQEEITTVEEHQKTIEIPDLNTVTEEKVEDEGFNLFEAMGSLMNSF